MRRFMPKDVRAAITEQANGYIEKAYEGYAQRGGREPCITVGEVTDYLRQSSQMPIDFRFATRDRQSKWTRSILEGLRKKGKLGSSQGRFRCYEPKKP